MSSPYCYHNGKHAITILFDISVPVPSTTFQTYNITLCDISCLFIVQKEKEKKKKIKRKY